MFYYYLFSFIYLFCLFRVLFVCLSVMSEGVWASNEYFFHLCIAYYVRLASHVSITISFFFHFLNVV